MDERYRLYKKLQQQIDSVMPILKGAEFLPNKVKIGKVEISICEFSYMAREFKEILDLTFENKFETIRTNCIPISLINYNVFFKEIQITMNEVRKDQVTLLYRTDEER